MKKTNLLLSLLLAGAFSSPLPAQTPKVWTAQELFTRNVGTREQQDRQFPPHKIIGNVYYVGTETLGSFLVTTPDGHILINTDYERNIPVIRDSVAKLGFRFTDIKIILGSHAHADHMEGDAAAKELSGAQVMAMEQDVPALERIRPGGKPHPIDRVLHDGDEVTLGGMTLVAHLTPGHTRGCTTWTLEAEEAGRSYDVVIIGSMGVNRGTNLLTNPQVPQIVDEYRQGFKVMHSLPADVPLGSHPAMFNMTEKHAKLGTGPNPYIDPEGYKMEVGIEEQAFNMELEDQKKAAGQ